MLVPTGTRVVYQGSVTGHRGEEFVVTLHEPQAEPNPDDQRYWLTSIAHPNQHLMNVRRESFEVVE